MEEPAMETETHHEPESEFPHSPWVEIGSFASPQHSPPMHEYSGFDYGSSQLMAVDSYGMSVPPPYASMPLPMPSHSWPSMLTTHSPFVASGLPASTTPTSVSPSATMCPVRKTSTGGTTPRRTLTDDDRRQMCIYHEENKTAKQTDIGALFGVERSTVSKVLRQKEKYLNPEDGSRSPIKRAKGRVPDIERALSNWAKNLHSQGHPLSDEMIKEKALFFASICGCPEGKEKVSTAAWLEKFKQKNNLLGAKMRRGSTGIRSCSNSPIQLNTEFGSALRSPGSHSPTSSIDSFGSPLSPTSQERNKHDMAELPDLTGGYQHGYSNSTTSLDTSSAGMVSPTTPTSQSRLPFTNSDTNRLHSQTSPPVPIDPTLLSADDTTDPHRQKRELQQSLTVSTLQSPLEMDDSKPAMFPVRQTNVIKRNRSNPEITTKYMPPRSKSTTISPVSSPGSPTQDEARRALELVINYFDHQPAGLAAQEYMTIVKLMERLELARSQAGFLLSGLPRIDEHEDIHIPHVTKKRSIHNLG
ncbi:transcriptional regulator family: Centromere protein B, DNA-binding region [Penicillium roqueforti]|uniref:Probable transposable element n=1 Tax=Penicillium roqueforti (strain FM164) TaxID=1365484 RepID=W6QCL6_PENRF|nr:transcriptional regulator family: Centromere protein B, DNA-binding region [Penicillium roqueforti]CDM33796.1 Probable transposable element [Penicillium roqueforti FM164]KAF9248658.1 transcriptional regulator family: Centromere protein B, DNA-binding region [Penicillium roqueforti]KAI1838266.1 transcriptional regulator family: Centromere protein B, DNA-binding region [Penicillium roqueforti]KAI2681787.1 transcriptional regulator family: Centromere protein B, DNA-binding region [Penicillium r